MKSGCIRTFIAVLPCLLLLCAAQKPPSVLDPAQADADFVRQGEYVADIDTAAGKMKLGVQVIALGDGKFHAVFYPGGLPGDGWDKARGREEADGMPDDPLAFKARSWGGRIGDNAMTITDAAGKELGKAAKVFRQGPTLGAKPPQGAIVLFDGTSGEEFKPGKMDGNLLTQGQTSVRKFQSHTLHIEFLLPYEPKGRGQGRANSGVYLQGRYEVQILDSFGLAGRNNECGGIYSVADPLVNMCFPPLSWQTFDIDFTAPQFDADGKKTANARMTVRHNGVLVHDNVEIKGPTTAAPFKESPEPGPLYLQDHGHPVRFRNIWVVPK